MAVYTDTSGATITTMIPAYYNRTWLERLQANLVFDKYGKQAPLPRGEGGQAVWHQLKNVGNGYVLDETTAAGTSAVSTRRVAVSLSWLGQLVDVTTRVDALAVNPVVTEVVDHMGYNAALTKDAFIGDKVGFGSACSTGISDKVPSALLPSVFTQGFPLYEGNTDTMYWTATALTNGKFSTVPTIAHVRGAVAQLRNLNTMPYDDGLFRGIIHPIMSKHVRNDSNFTTWMAYTNRAAMERGKLGAIEDVMFEESSAALVSPVSTAAWSGYVSTGNVYGTLIVGNGAYGVTKLRGEDAKVNILTGADKSDPHNLHTYVSYKMAVAAAVLNPSAGIILATLIAG